MLEGKLDGKEIQDRKQLHDTLAMELQFPVWYGANLDALYDCLTDIHIETRLTVLHSDKLRENLGPYADKLFYVLRRAARENPRFISAGEDSSFYK